MVRVFYLKNATTVQELQEISTTVRSVAEIRRAFTYSAQNALLLRGTPDQIALAEKLIQDLDKPKAEVVVDLIVMQASRGRVRELAAGLTSAGINVPIEYTGSGVTSSTSSTDDTTTTTAVALSRLARLSTNQFSLTVPSALLQLFASDSQTRIIQQPQVRAVENYKASLKIGDRVPYATGSYQPGTGTTGVSALVSTQFNYFDVGVNVDITPKVHGRDEVSLHVELEISNVSSYVDVGGLSQPVISQKKVVHDIRLKAGEVSVLGGLINTQDTRSVSGVPGLASIPILGSLFGPEHKEVSNGELLIALVPHVVRAPDITVPNIRGVLAGNDQTVKVNYASSLDATAAPDPAHKSGTVERDAPLQAGQAGLRFDSPSAIEVVAGSSVTVALGAQNLHDVRTALLAIRFDPNILRLSKVAAGALIANRQDVSLTDHTFDEAGETTIAEKGMPTGAGTSGSGQLLKLTFDAVTPGTASVSVGKAALTGVGDQRCSVAEASVKVLVKDGQATGGL